MRLQTRLKVLIDNFRHHESAYKKMLDMKRKEINVAAKILKDDFPEAYEELKKEFPELMSNENT